MPQHQPTRLLQTRRPKRTTMSLAHTYYINTTLRTTHLRGTANSVTTAFYTVLALCQFCLRRVFTRFWRGGLSTGALTLLCYNVRLLNHCSLILQCKSVKKRQLCSTFWAWNRILFYGTEFCSIEQNSVTRSKRGT